MRATPKLMMILGLLLLVWGWMNINFVIWVSSKNSRINFAAAKVTERMTAEETRRVFDMPEGVPDRESWLRSVLGGEYSSHVTGVFGLHVLPWMGLGVVLLAWGAAEGRARRKYFPVSC